MYSWATSFLFAYVSSALLRATISSVERNCGWDTVIIDGVRNAQDYHAVFSVSTLIQLERIRVNDAAIEAKYRERRLERRLDHRLAIYKDPVRE